MIDPNDTTIDPTLEPEQAALAAAEAEDTASRDAAATQQAADDAAVAEAAKVAEPEPQADPVATAIAENTAATRALAEQIAAGREQPAAAAVEEQAPQPRDYDAELRALEDKYDNGDIDQAEFRRQERELLPAHTRDEPLAAVPQQQEDYDEAARKMHEAAQEAAWNEANTRFFADPGNAALIADNVKKAGFQAAVNDAFAESKGKLSFDEVLVKARERITGVPSVDPQAAIKNANFNRQDKTEPAATLRDVPSAANNADSPAATLDSMSVADLEDALMRMSPEAAAKYYASAPGGLNDNARQH